MVYILINLQIFYSVYYQILNKSIIHLSINEKPLRDQYLKIQNERETVTKSLLLYTLKTL